MKSPNDQPVTPAAIQDAAARIAPFAHRTPTEHSASLSAASGAECWLKFELWQATGSFKIRGAANRLALLSPDERQRGILTVSAGNHAQGIATVAAALGIPAIIVVPEDASPAKVAALRHADPQWVDLRQIGRDYDAAEAAGIALARELGRTYISPYNDPAVIAGQGTVALELLEDVPALDTILVPVGGGGLAAGVALWAHHVHPHIKVFGVQSEASPAMHASFAERANVTVPVAASLADGLSGNIEAGSITVPLCLRELAGMTLVSEAAIARAMRWLADAHHVIAEGAAVVGVAAVLSGSYAPQSGERIGIILTGRNFTTTRFLAALQQA
jgi:threonine dehydratase